MYKIKALFVPGQEISDVCLDFMQPFDAGGPVPHMRLPGNTKISAIDVGIPALKAGRDEPSSSKTKIKYCRVRVLRKHRSVYVYRLLYCGIIFHLLPGFPFFGRLTQAHAAVDFGNKRMRFHSFRGEPAEEQMSPSPQSHSWMGQAPTRWRSATRTLSDPEELKATSSCRSSLVSHIGFESLA